MPELKSTSTVLPKLAEEGQDLPHVGDVRHAAASVTGSRVSRVAQRIGSTAFLLADGVIVPLNGRPPFTISLAMTMFPSKRHGLNRAYRQVTQTM